MSELTEIKAAIERNSRDIKELKAEFRKFQQTLIGNGDYDRSVMARLRDLERDALHSISWAWVVDKFMGPLITVIVNAIVLWLIFRTHP